MTAIAALLAAIAWQANAADAVIESGLFRVEYPPDRETLARQSLAVLEAALEEYAPRLGGGTAPIVVRICETHGDFVREAGYFAQPSVIALARPERGRIAVRAPEQLPSQGIFVTALRHELVHVLLARSTGPGNLPTWLNEGIAMTLSGERRWDSGMRVARMYLTGRIVPYYELMHTMGDPGREGPYGDAYAQSLSMTNFLIDMLGEEAFWELIAELADTRFGVALERRAGMTPADFWQAWHDSLWRVALISSVVSGFTLFQGMGLLAMLAYLRVRRRNQAVLTRWEREETEPALVTVSELESGEAYPWEEDEGEP